MKYSVVLLAAGSGQRMSGAVADKLLQEFGGETAFARLTRTFSNAGDWARWVIVYRDEPQRKLLEQQLCPHATQHPVDWVRGGTERADSVRAALHCLQNETGSVLIHDAARPFVGIPQLQMVREALLSHPAVSLAHRVTDTVKQAPRDGDVANQPVFLETLQRERLWAVETPQAFHLPVIREAHLKADPQQPLTDDLIAVENCGVPIRLIENTEYNLKLTTPRDLPLAEMLANRQNNSHMETALTQRIGHGYDIHRFIAGRPLILGGVQIPSDLGLDGHSDADVLTHALADAILGSMGLPDIGHYFPNTDPNIAGINSLEILQKAVSEAANRGYIVGNADVSIIAEKPKIGPYTSAMQEVLSAKLGVTPDRVGIKATTNEKIGDLGRGAGIAVNAVVLMIRQKPHQPQKTA